MGKGRNRNRALHKRRDQFRNFVDAQSSAEELSELNPDTIRTVRLHQMQNNRNNAGTTKNNIVSDHNRRSYSDRKAKFGDRITKFKNRSRNRKQIVPEAVLVTTASRDGSSDVLQRSESRSSSGEAECEDRNMDCSEMTDNDDDDDDNATDDDHEYENRIFRSENDNDHDHNDQCCVDNDRNVEDDSIEKESCDRDNNALQGHTIVIESQCTSDNSPPFSSCPGSAASATIDRENDDRVDHTLCSDNMADAEIHDHNQSDDDEDVVVEDKDDDESDESSDLCDHNSTETNASISVVHESVKGGITQEFEHFEHDHQLNEDMGQPNSKARSRKKSQISSNIVIPTITVSDHSDELPDINTTESDEVFFDSAPSFDIENSVKGSDISSVVIEAVDNQNVETESKSSDGNSDEYVLSESDEVILISDNECNEGPTLPENEAISGSAIAPVLSEEATVIEKYEESDHKFDTILLEKQTDSPDSGIESTAHTVVGSVADAEGPMHINRESELYMRGSSTDCDESILPNDYDIQDQAKGYTDDPDLEDDQSDEDDDESDEDHSVPKKRPIIIDSISLPDVVVETTTAMGNTHPTKPPEAAEEKNAIIIIDHNENDTRDLLNHEARYSAQLEDAQKMVYTAQAKVSELQSRIDQLENDLSIKTWNIDRLQGELRSAYKEDEGVRKRLKLLEEELNQTKEKLTETEDDMRRKYDDLETEYTKLQDKYHSIHELAGTLQTQLAFAQSDTDQCRAEMERLRQEKDEEIDRLHKAIEDARVEKQEQEKKWQKEFERLRNQNADQEEHLMSDCEWRLRSMQKSCKEKVEAAEKAKTEALQKAEHTEKEADDKMAEVRHLRSFQAEVVQLRGLTNDQQESLINMTEQLNDMRSELEAANKELEEEIKNVKKIRMQCNNALNDKDREMVQKIEEARGEVAQMWEQKLLDEMIRLKHELESVHHEEKQEGLSKLQLEHLEEIKTLTNRYDENERELRKEINMLREKLVAKAQEFEELQTKTDNALVKTRMHLEKADREYVQAMEREALKREELAESLRQDFEREKLEMEEHFRVRLNHVKDEFAKELADTSEEMALRHRKDLEQQWEQLTSEKEKAMQFMESRHRIKVDEAEQRLKELKIDHQRDIKELKQNYDIERTTLESRDLHNTHEIEQLHRKCRCLTNLFEEMRMRYERRDPRPEDLREISDLRNRCEAQERDLQHLTERLRQIQMETDEQKSSSSPSSSRKNKSLRKPPPKTIPTSCDVIYEENEETDPQPTEAAVNGVTDDATETLV